MWKVFFIGMVLLGLMLRTNVRTVGLSELGHAGAGTYKVQAALVPGADGQSGTLVSNGVTWPVSGNVGSGSGGLGTATVTKTGNSLRLVAWQGTGISEGVGNGEVGQRGGEVVRVRVSQDKVYGQFRGWGWLPITAPPAPGRQP